ncbi:MAG: hypothetical protein K0R66_139 [Gammaproteobacteria bacterium]|jgi:hypothetical protein|nr:hypothetical protein [Gammaproteobacteria bacterium]
MYILNNDKDLGQFLSYLKQLIKSLPWKVSLFTSLPSGIKEMLSVLDNPKMADSAKLSKIFRIVRDKYAGSSSSRSEETHFFYGALKYFISRGEGQDMFPDITLEQWKKAFEAVKAGTEEGHILSSILEGLDASYSGRAEGEAPKLGAEIGRAFETSAFAIHLAMCYYPFNFIQLGLLEIQESARQHKVEYDLNTAWISSHRSSRDYIQQGLDLKYKSLEHLLEMGISGDDLYFYLKRDKEDVAHLTDQNFDLEALMLCVHAKAPIGEKLKSQGTSVAIEKACQSAVEVSDESRNKTKSYLECVKDLNFQLSEKNLQDLKALRRLVSVNWSEHPAEKAEVLELLAEALYNHGWSKRGALVWLRKAYRDASIAEQERSNPSSNSPSPGDSGH